MAEIRRWPKFAVIKWKGEPRSAMAYKGDLGFPGTILDDQVAGVWNPMAKIEIEPSKLDSGGRYFNMRFSHSNKYWAREGGLVSAVSNQPVEDLSSPTCTLFEQSNFDDEGNFDLVHVQSGGRVGMGPDSRISVVDGNDGRKVTFLDWESLFKLPVMVNLVFRGSNEGLRFLKVYNHNDGHPYMQFSAPDNSDPTVRHQVELMPEGDVRIKCVSTGGYWRLSPGWILADGQSDTLVNARFEPVKFVVNIIALLSVDLNRFCTPLTRDGLTDCLNASSDDFIDEAKLMVEELVMERKINNVSYLMSESRVYDEEPYVAGTTTLVNSTDQDRSMRDEIPYEKEMSYSFANSISLHTNVPSTIEAGVLVIDDTSSIVVDSEINRRFYWEEVTKSSKSVVAPVTVFVPAMSSVKVKYVGTKGTCSVPFSYSRQDTSSIDGQLIETGDIDGIYTGTSCYNFNIQADKPRPL